VRAEGTGEKLLHTEAEEGGTEEEKEGPPAKSFGSLAVGFKHD
jgi:hypothetical protein